MKFKHTLASPYVNGDLQNLDLLTYKGLYPYDYMDDFEKFNDRALPSKEKFYSDLTQEHISDIDYLRAETVWKTMDLKDMGEYHDLYL